MSSIMDEIRRRYAENGAIEYYSLSKENQQRLKESGFKPPKYQPLYETKKAPIVKGNTIADFRRNEFESPAAKAKVAPVETKPKSTLRKVLDANNQFAEGLSSGLTMGLDRPVEKGIDFLYEKITGKQAPSPIMPQTKAEQRAYNIGDVIGSFAPVTGLYKTVGTQALRLIPKTAPKAIQSVARTFVPGAATGGIFEGTRSASRGDDASTIAKNAAIGGAVGGAGDVVLGAISKPIGKFLGKQVTPILDNLDLRKGPLALPPSRVADALPESRIGGLLPEYASDPVGVVRAGGNISQPRLPITGMSNRTPKTLRPVDQVGRSMQELEQGILDAQNYIRHNDILAAYPEGTTIEQAYDDIAKNIGVDLRVLMSNVENATTQPSIKDIAKKQSEYVKLRMAAGAGPQKLGREGKIARAIGQVDNIGNAENINQQAITQQAAQQRHPIEAEIARNVLNTTSNPARMESILSAYPELRTKAVNSRLTKLKKVAPQQKQPGVMDEFLANRVGQQTNNRQQGMNMSDKLMGEGSISAAKAHIPGKMEPTGNPGEKVRSFNVSAYNSKNVSREVKDNLFFDMQPGEPGTYQVRTHDMLSRESSRYIAENPEKALQFTTDPETIANEPDLAVAVGIKLSSLYQDIGKFNEAQDALNIVSEQLTKHGQAISASKLLNKMSPEGLLQSLKKQFENLNKEGLKKYGKKWKDISLTGEEVKAVNNLKPGNEEQYGTVLANIQTRVADDLPANLMEKFTAWRHMAMLLNPKTQTRNIVGNSIMLGMRRTAKQVSAAIQHIVLPANERTQVFKIKDEYKNLAESYYKANEKRLLEGAKSKFRDDIKLNIPDKRVFDTNALEKTRKATYKLLEMGDTPFFKNAYINRLASYAQARGVKNLHDLPQDAFETALMEAEQATYTDTSKLADFLNKMKKVDATSSLGSKSLAFITDTVVPFTKTPINVIKRGIQYSPAGILNGIHKWTSQGAAAKGIDELAKGLTGTGVIGLGFLLAKNGILTGKAEKDKDKREYEGSVGRRAFSVLGKFTYDWAQPFSIPLSMGVEAYNAVKDNGVSIAKLEKAIMDNDTKALTGIVTVAAQSMYDAIESSGDTVFNMSVLQGIAQIMGSGGGPGEITSNVAKYVPQSYISQSIPSFSKQVAGVVDPVVRKSYVPGNLSESIKATALSGIPGLSKYAEPKQTPFGRNFKRPENAATRAFFQLVSPANIATDQGANPVIQKELDRLGEQGLTNQYPTMVPNYIEKTQQYPKITLTPKEHTRYQARTGQLTEQEFIKLLRSGKYRAARPNNKSNKTVDQVKADMLADAISESKQKAKREILKSRGIKVKDK